MPPRRNAATTVLLPGGRRAGSECADGRSEADGRAFEPHPEKRRAQELAAAARAAINVSGAGRTGSAHRRVPNASGWNAPRLLTSSDRPRGTGRLNRQHLLHRASRRPKTRRWPKAAAAPHRRASSTLDRVQVDAINANGAVRERRIVRAFDDFTTSRPRERADGGTEYRGGGGQRHDGCRINRRAGHAARGRRLFVMRRQRGRLVADEAAIPPAVAHNAQRSRRSSCASCWVSKSDGSLTEAQRGGRKGYP